MARPRKPTNILKLRGADKKNPQRFRDRSGEPGDDRPIGDPPDYFTDAERQAWADLVDNAVPGVLWQADKIAIESASRLVAKMRAQAVTDQNRRNEMLRMVGETDFTDPDQMKQTLLRVVEFASEIPDYKATDQTNLTKLLAQMGMTPADRSRINLQKPDPQNEWDEFLGTC